MKDRFGDSPDLRMVCLDENGDVNALGDYNHDKGEDKGCGYFDLVSLDRSMKVSEFLNLNFSGDNWSTEHWGVAVKCAIDEEDDVLRAIEVDEDGNSFFKTNIGGEDVIACRLGAVISEDGYQVIDDAPSFKDYLLHTYIPRLKENL
jgi:hypothetical protein